MGELYTTCEIQTSSHSNHIENWRNQFRGEGLGLPSRGCWPSPTPSPRNLRLTAPEYTYLYYSSMFLRQFDGIFMPFWVSKKYLNSGWLVQKSSVYIVADWMGEIIWRFLCFWLVSAIQGVLKVQAQCWKYHHTHPYTRDTKLHFLKCQRGIIHIYCK